MPALTEIQSVVIDVDGVLIRGERPLPGVGELFSLLRRRSIPFLIATNNAAVHPQDLRLRLNNLGADLQIEQILTSGQATAAFLRRRFPPETPVFALGEPALHAALREQEFQLLESEKGARVVVVGLDRTATWQKLTQAALAIQAGALFVGTNADVTFPFERGEGIGTGALLACIQAATGVAPVTVGKPKPHLYREAIRRLGTPARLTLALGDRLETDILGGKRAEMATALVLTGISQREDLLGSEVQPDWVFEDLPALCQALDEDVS